MIVWFLALNPLLRKAIYVAAALLAIFLFIRWYGNAQYYKGEDAGIKKESMRLLEAKKSEWKAREDELKKQAEQQSAQSKVLAAQQAEIEKLRLSLNGTLYQIQAQNKAKVETSNAIVIAIPADELDSAIRTQSAKLGPPAIK